MSTTERDHKLNILLERIGIEASDVERVSARRDLFAARKEEFADFFHRTFMDIADTRAIIEHQDHPERLVRMWAHWFEYVFGSPKESDLVDYLWRVGARHVQVNLDHRYANLGFSVIRRFCHDIVGSEVPAGERAPLLRSIDKILDLCLLVETDAFIENTARCDLEVMREVADRVRNPVLVIGGNLRRLQKRTEAGSSEYGVYERLMVENKRLERMVRDIRVYMELFQGEPVFAPVDVGAVLSAALDKLRAERSGEVRVEMRIDPSSAMVSGDEGNLGYLFYYLLENSLDAVDPVTGLVTVSSRPDAAIPRNLRIEIFNTGTPPRPEEIEKLFNPFYSTKPEGSGFGLPIARLVTRKHFGKIIMQAAGEEGTIVTVTLPQAVG